MFIWKNLFKKRVGNSPIFFKKWWRVGIFLSIFLTLVFLHFDSATTRRSQAASESDKAALKEILKKEIEEIEKQIEDYEEAIDYTKIETKSLSDEIKNFDFQIKKIELEIKRTEFVLKEAELEIGERENEISKIENFLSQRKILLREFIREIHKFDEHSFLEIILANNRLSDFFNEAQAFQNIHNNLQSALEELRGFKKKLEFERGAYEEERTEQLFLSRLQKLQEVELKDKREGRKRLLQVTRGEEKKYQELLKGAKKSVTEIKKQLFVLEGMAITFEEALNHAKFASEKTGVRPALLLAVLQVETKLGTDLGSGNWKKDMHSRDREAFKEICKKLNLDPDLVPVSRRPSIDYWGGAMGPAQFLPNTWLVYEKEISQLTGHNPPSPWNLDDAFVATALKLAKSGANLRTYEAERKAVLIFFAGSRWNNPRHSFYGARVMTAAETFQKQINILEGK